MIEVWSGSGNGDADRLALRDRGAAKGGERAGARVLVVDDDVSILETVTAILSSEGYQVAAANGGEQALAMLRTWHPTLVLLDMRMPIMDGWADEIGAAGHLDKPFGLLQLLACVEEHGSGKKPN